MSGQAIPEAFQELIAEPGWRHPDVGMWVWRRRGTYDERPFESSGTTARGGSRMSLMAMSS